MDKCRPPWLGGKENRTNLRGIIDYTSLGICEYKLSRKGLKKMINKLDDVKRKD